MKKLYKYIIGAVLVFLLGFMVCRWTTRPEVITNTTTEYVYDTIVRTIYKDKIVQKIDTIFYPDIDSIFLPSDVDTAAILHDYYAVYGYYREWSDSLLYVSIRDTITRNKILSGDLNYKILRPQTVINNTTEIKNYSSYLYVGVDVPIGHYDMTEVNLLWSNKRFYTGVGYSPLYEKPYFSLKLGTKIIGW